MATTEQLLEEGERSTSRSGDDLPTVGIDDCERSVLGYGFGEGSAEALLIGSDEGGSLGVAIGVEHSFD